VAIALASRGLLGDYGNGYDERELNLRPPTKVRKETFQECQDFSLNFTMRLQLACARIVQILLSTGSHYITHADWGCVDGEHTAWIIVEGDSKEQARCICLPLFGPKPRLSN
jgi:hypothetical protein